jgi:hypothetical protein
LKPAIKYTLRILAGIIALFLLACIIALIYLSANKAAVLKKVNTELSSRIKGEISIQDMDIGFFRTFPKVSIGLYRVTVRDSLWKQHHHDLLKADKVLASLNLFRLISGHLTVDKIILEKGSAWLFTDSTGYNNASILRNQHGAEKNKRFEFPNIEVRDSRLVIEKKERNKLFDFEIRHLNCIVKRKENNLFLTTNLSVLVHGLAFNRKNGSFLEEKDVSGKFSAQFNTKSKILQFENIRLQLDRHPFNFTGKFFLDLVPAPFVLSVKTENIRYQEAKTLLSSNIRKKLDQYNMENPFDISAAFDGTDPENRTPLVHIKIIAKNNSITTPITGFSDVSFSGSFSNEWIPGQGRGDENSVLRFNAFAGNWQDIPFRSDSIIISNLIHPLLSCDLHSSFNLTALNNLTEDQAIRFTKGGARADIVYKGPVTGGDSINTERNIAGNISLDSASVDYLPRNFELRACKSRIRLKDKNIYIDQFTANAGSTVLNINGDIKNVLSQMDKNPDKISIDWSVSSPKLNLKDFTVFLKKRTVTVSKKKNKILVARAISTLSSTLNEYDMHLQLKARQLIYKKFTASNFSAGIILTGDKILLKDALLEHAGGLLRADGSVDNMGSDNPVAIRAHMNKMDISKVFSAFDNFGQHAILDENLKGKLDADININGLISDRAAIVSNSLKGTIDFNINEGALIGYEPVEKISQIAFKNRNFSDIHFGELQNRLEINGTAIKVNRMEVHSTVLTMFVEGIYDVKKGADMSIQIPLNNLKANKKDTLLVNNGVDSKTGVSLRLRAKTGDDGKLKISWDPFKKSLKKTRRKK